MEKINLQICLGFLAYIGIFNSISAKETNNLSSADKLIVEGALCFSNRDLEKAIADFTIVIQSNPTNAYALFNRANAYRANGEFKKSIEDFNEFIVLNSTNDLAFKGRASDFAEIGDFDKAINDWNQGLRLKPNDATALAMRGFCYDSKGQFDNAQKDYYQGIKIDSKNASAWNNLGWLRATCPVASMRNGAEAIKAATKACELSNWMKWTRVDTLAAAFAEAGDFQQAIKYQKRALELVKAGDKNVEEIQSRLVLYEQRRPYRQIYKP
jgi:tetratricopeptide (TPR) repeat protein